MERFQASYEEQTKALDTDVNPVLLDVMSRSFKSASTQLQVELWGNTAAFAPCRVDNRQTVAFIHALHTSQSKTPLTHLTLAYHHLGLRDEHEALVTRSLASLVFSSPNHAKIGQQIIPEKIPNALTIATSLTHLDLRGNDLTGDVLWDFTQCLFESGLASKLEILNLNGNPLGASGGLGLARVLASPESRLKELDVGNTQLGHDSLIRLCDALFSNSDSTCLESLDLSNHESNHVDEEVHQHVAKMLERNTTLKTLKFEKHSMGDLSAKVFAERLAENTTLTYLSLAGNVMGDVGACALARLLLQAGNNLRTLDLTSNHIANAGAEAFGQVLAKDPTQGLLSLRRLFVGWNRMHDLGLTHLLLGLRKGRSTRECPLEELGLWGNHFEQLSAEVLAQVQDDGLTSGPQLSIDTLAYRVMDSREFQVAHQDIGRTL